MENRRIRVLVVDDSAVVRSLISEALEKDAGIEVVGRAPDPYVARELVMTTKPDVLTLDVEMPKMDGLTFLGRLMHFRPMPVVVISSLTPQGSDIAMRALELGAVEVLCKPGSAYRVSELAGILSRTVRAAAAAQVRPMQAPGAHPKPPTPLGLARTTSRVLAIGASTGGPDAVHQVLARLPGDTPGTVIVQHMPPMFTRQFAQRLGQTSIMRVSEAQGGEELLPGLAFVAPGGHHMVVERSGAKYVVHLREGPQIHYQKPAVDVTFRSVAAAAGANAVGVLLTGMGADGADGLKAMRAAGARTIAQDEATSVVYGMPKVAAEIGAVEQVLPLDRIAEAIGRAFTRMSP
jgi:two-component system chemotaxis response regulator CheB